MDPDRRRSVIVTLTILGAGGAMFLTPLIPEGKEYKRNQYATLEDCQRDYSRSQCEPPHGSGGGGGGGGGYWRGPEYVANRTLPEARLDAGAGREGLAAHVESSVRGGFGKIGGFMRAIG